MRKHMQAVAALVAVAVLAVGTAAMARDIVIPVPTVELTIDGSSGLTPKALSKTKYTPVAFTAAGSVRTLDGAQAPVLREVRLDAPNTALDTTGYPVCRGGWRDLRDPKAVERACKGAIVGRGTVTVAFAFPGHPVPGGAPLLAVNGGTAGATTTLYLHAFIERPLTTAITATVKARKSAGGIKAIASIPKIANGAGSVTDFSLKIDKKYTYKGKKVSVLSAKCIGGKITAKVTAKFYDNSQLSADVLRTCTPKP